MLSDPEAVREVFRGDPEVLHSGEANALFTATVGRHSVLVLDEAPHARQRRVLVPPLKGERMRAFFDAMRLETLEAVRAWPRDAPFPALPTMRRITLRVILRTALGLAPGPEMDRFERKIETVPVQRPAAIRPGAHDDHPDPPAERVAVGPAVPATERPRRRPVRVHRGAAAGRAPAERRERARRLARGDARGRLAAR